MKPQRGSRDGSGSARREALPLRGWIVGPVVQGVVGRVNCGEGDVTIELAGDSAGLRKARGAFFTPPEVTRFLCEWAITSPEDRVLEPSCGEGSVT